MRILCGDSTHGHRDVKPPLIPRHEPPILHAAKPQGAPPFPGRGRRTPHRTGAASSAYPADEPSPGPPWASRGRFGQQAEAKRPWHDGTQESGQAEALHVIDHSHIAGHEWSVPLPVSAQLRGESL
jgi:hypothetical protein